MTDNEIIKALECCIAESGSGCSECPYTHYYEGCRIRRNNDCIDLINLQKAEIERLKEYETALKKGCALSRCINKGFVQDEAYKEFAEMAKEATFHYYDSEIDDVYKVLTEGGNEDGTNHS